MSATPFLTDSVIFLSPPHAEDLQEIYIAVRESLKELHPWIDWATDVYDFGSASRWFDHVQQAWSHSTAFQFAIKDVQSGQFLGICGLDGIDKKSCCCNLSYWVRTGASGRGIATRAVRLVVRFGFQKLGLVRAEIVIAASNHSSKRVAQKVGARYEGTKNDGMVVRSEVYDALLFSLNRAESDDVFRPD